MDVYFRDGVGDWRRVAENAFAMSMAVDLAAQGIARFAEATASINLGAVEFDGLAELFQLSDANRRVLRLRRQHKAKARGKNWRAA